MASVLPSIPWKPNPLTGISILDCPEQIQTSPKVMSLTVSFSLPLFTVME